MQSPQLTLSTMTALAPLDTPIIMRATSMEILSKAIERLGNRIKITFTHFSDGILLQSKQPILSEFLPNSNFLNGALLFNESAKNLIEQLSPPFFLVSPMSLEKWPALANLHIWKKTPLGVGKSEWILKRVQDVPTLQDYRALDKNDYLEFGIMDAFTEWYVAYGREGSEWIPSGKFRITDVDNRNFFASQIFTKDEVDNYRLWEALDAHFPTRNIYFIAPSTSEFPQERGFHLEGKIHIYHSGKY
jgi:hypothetical protein